MILVVAMKLGWFITQQSEKTADENTHDSLNLPYVEISVSG